MRVADLVAPIPLETFDREIFGRRPFHIPASEAAPAKAPIDWARMNALLALRSHWSEAYLKLIMNSRPVLPEFYFDESDTLGGPVRRADPAKVNVFLSMGASLVANSLEDVAPEVRAITDALADHYAGHAGANAYCSFEGVQAFASHCDLHEVFAVQCEGEKVWRIYENRAEAPVEALTGDDAQALIDSVKGQVLMEVRMRPGDLLYIPRGYYHDALASAGASLHVTCSLIPLTGRILFRLLEALAVEDPAFRDYLPDARLDQGKPLAARLADLGDRLRAMLTTERLRNEVGDRQRALARHEPPFGLPHRQPLHFYARTQKRADLRLGPDGLLLSCGGQEIALGWLDSAVEWVLERRGFSLEELYANFQHLDPEALRRGMEQLERHDLIRAYVPDR